MSIKFTYSFYSFEESVGFDLVVQYFVMRVLVFPFVVKTIPLLLITFGLSFFVDSHEERYPKLESVLITYRMMAMAVLMVWCW